MTVRGKSYDPRSVYPSRSFTNQQLGELDRIWTLIFGMGTNHVTNTQHNWAVGKSHVSIFYNASKFIR